MMCQAKNECYLNAASLVHGCGKENIRPADDIVSEKVSDKEAAIGMGAGGGLYRASGIAAGIILFALTFLIYVENILKLKCRYMLFRVTTDSAIDMVPEVHRIFKDQNIKLDNFQVNITGARHIIQFDADVTQRQQDHVLTAMTRPGISVEMLPVERQSE